MGSANWDQLNACGIVSFLVATGYLITEVKNHCMYMHATCPVLYSLDTNLSSTTPAILSSHAGLALESKMPSNSCSGYSMSVPKGVMQALIGIKPNSGLYCLARPCTGIKTIQFLSRPQQVSAHDLCKHWNHAFCNWNQRYHPILVQVTVCRCQ